MVAHMNQFTRAGATALLFLTLVAASLVAASLVAASPALAQGDPTQLGVFSDWAAYSYKTAESKVCYVSASPKSMAPKSVKRDPAFFLITNMPGRKPAVKGEVSTIIGYPFKEGATVRLTIDEQGFDMFSKGDTAWVETGADKQVVTAMKAGQTLTIKGTSWRGTETEDTYSLAGISAALSAIDKACK
jgi:invasion protein IalB